MVKGELVGHHKVIRCILLYNVYLNSLHFLNMEYRDMGDNIRNYRRRLKLTQEELGERVGVTWEMISRYERGQSSPINKLGKIAKALGVSVTELIDDSKGFGSSIPLFVKIPKDFSFERRNSTIFYTCPQWLYRLDPDVFAIDTDLVNKKDFIPEKEGYIFISPNSIVEEEDLVLVEEDKELKLEEYSQFGNPPIGKVMSQEIIYNKQ